MHVYACTCVCIHVHMHVDVHVFVCVFVHPVGSVTDSLLDFIYCIV